MARDRRWVADLGVMRSGLVAELDLLILCLVGALPGAPPFFTIVTERSRGGDGACEHRRRNEQPALRIRSSKTRSEKFLKLKVFEFVDKFYHLHCV